MRTDGGIAAARRIGYIDRRAVDMSLKASTAIKASFTPMKMKELERETGIGRETIRFYIREGLLPEPVRPKRNVASYGPSHVARLNLIKRLQQERFLPLSVIKTIVATEEENPVKGFESFIGLESRLGPLLSEGRNFGPLKLEDAASAAGVSMDDVRALAGIGFLTIDVKDGSEFLNQRNVRLLELIGEWRAAGYTTEAGFPIEVYRIYAEVTEVLAHRAVAQFYKAFGEKVPTEEAVQMAAHGIRLINEMMPLLRIEKIIREVERVSATGALTPDEKDGTA
ncbi:MAG: MerR family transcriptional regulator [Parvibaculum sp.]|uniref:MerR family transcriptional regulator n=1 Tax=Parvibaculum sp. TaxID=2024848 RepID=UPI003C72AAE5